MNDIALFKLKNKIILNEFVQLACLPTKNLITTPDTISYAVGWGLLGYFGELADLQRNVMLTIYDQNACYMTAPFVEKNNESQICAGDLNGNKVILYELFF